MPAVHIYDPALCCPSGVCGPSVDKELVRIQSDLEWLKSKGVEVTRHNLAQQPADFASETAVRDRLQRQGQDVLPLILVDGEIMVAGFYPTRSQLALLTKVPEEDSSCCGSEESCCAPAEEAPKEEESSCCSGSEGCC